MTDAPVTKANDDEKTEEQQARDAREVRRAEIRAKTAAMRARAADLRERKAPERSE